MFLKNCPYKANKNLKSILFFTILFFNNLYIYSFDYTDFILNSNRYMNSEIFDILYKAGLEDSIQISKLLGQRDDPFIEDIIFNILSNRENMDNFELLLENILKNANNQISEKKLLWLESNRYAYFALIKENNTFNNPYLKMHIISLMENLDNIDIKTYIMIDMQNVLDIIKNNNGFLLPGYKRLLLELLRIIRNSQDSDFNEIILNILEETREEDIVDICRISIIK